MARSGKVSVGTYYNEGETDRVNCQPVMDSPIRMFEREIRGGRDGRNPKADPGLLVRERLPQVAQIYRRVSVMLAQAAVKR